MGNNCVGPNLGGGGNGFLQSVSAAVWKTRPPEARLPPPNAEDINKTPSTPENAVKDSSKPESSAGGKVSVQSTPPEQVKIAAAELKPLEHEKPVKAAASSAVASAAGGGGVAATAGAGGAGEGDADKPKKPTHVKRVSSVGLQVESVLGRKTENIKDFYSLGRKLGQGQFGTTFLCMAKRTNKEFACKSIAKRKLTTQEDVEDVRREIRIMHHLAGHPNVIQIVGAYEDAVAVHVVMELCAGGELFDRIIQRGHYSERKAAELTRLILGVVQACHSLGVMHRDLKPENFLFVGHEEESALKTIDFGLSVFFRPGIFILFVLSLCQHYCSC